MSDATNNSLALSRKSPYLQSLLNPMEYISSIPDDVNYRHTLKSETVTYNVTLDGFGSNAAGLFLIFSNTSSPIVGAHYEYASTVGTMSFVEYLRTAQDISQNYNYARHISAAYDFIANTISTTNFVISGTFNALTYEGTPTELFGEYVNGSRTDFNKMYNGILASQTSPLDKVGNQMTAKGIRVLALPIAFEQPMVRLDDPVIATSPYELAGATSSRKEDINTSISYQYSSAIADPASYIRIASGTNLLSLTCDIPDGDVRITLSLSCTADTVGTVAGINLRISTLSPFGIQTGDFEDCNLSYGQQANVLVTFNSLVMIRTTQPLGKILIDCISTPGLSNIRGAAINVMVDAYNCGYNGNTQPIQAILYTNVPTGTAMTISGIKNYELIPNPQLKKNLPTMYMFTDHAELQYVKKILSIRDKLAIHTVAPIEVFQSRQPLMDEYADLNKHEMAESFSWGNLLRGIKKLAVPALTAFAPEFAPLIHGASQAIDSIFPEAMSATSKAWSASLPSDYSFVSNETFDKINADDDVPDDSLLGITDLVGSNGYVPEKRFVSAHIHTLSMDETCSLFPVIIVRDDMEKAAVIRNPGMARVCLYGALTGDHREYLPEDAPSYTDPKTGFTLFNYILDVGVQFPFSLTKDITLLPVFETDGDSLSVPRGAVPVHDFSCTLSVYHAMTTHIRGVYGPLSGQISMPKQGCTGKPMVYPVAFTPEKRAYCRSIGMGLMAPNKVPVPYGALLMAVTAIKRITPLPIMMGEEPFPVRGMALSSAGAIDPMAQFGSILSGLADSMKTITSRLDTLEQPKKNVSFPKPIIKTQTESINMEPDFDEPFEEAFEEPSNPRDTPSNVEASDWDELLDELKDALDRGVQPNTIVRTLRTLQASARRTGRSVSPARAQEEKYKNLAARLMKSALFSKFDQTKLALWLKSNQGGLTEAQMHYLRNTGKMPPAGSTPPHSSRAEKPKGVVATPQYSEAEKKARSLSRLLSNSHRWIVNSTSKRMLKNTVTALTNAGAPTNGSDLTAWIYEQKKWTPPTTYEGRAEISDPLFVDEEKAPRERAGWYNPVTGSYVQDVKMRDLSVSRGQRNNWKSPKEGDGFTRGPERRQPVTEADVTSMLNDEDYPELEAAPATVTRQSRTASRGNRGTRSAVDLLGDLT